MPSEYPPNSSSLFLPSLSLSLSFPHSPSLSLSLAFSFLFLLSLLCFARRKARRNRENGRN